MAWGRLLVMGVQLIEDAAEVVELVSGFGELALGGKALVVGEVFAGFGDEGMGVG